MDARYRRSALIAIGGIFALAILLSYLFYPLYRSMQMAIFDIDQSAGPDPGINLREVARRSDVLLGREVTISGQLDQVLGPHAVIIGNHTPFFGETVLVISREPVTGLIDTPLESINALRVTGIVEHFDQNALESELGIVLDEQVLGDRAGEPVLIASDMGANPPFAIGPGDKELPSSSDFFDIGVTTDDIVANPDEYIGQRVTVSGEIEHVVASSVLFEIDDDFLLVLNPQTGVVPLLESTAVVEGEVRRFDATEIRERYGIELDLPNLQEYQGRPVVVADELELIQ